MAVSVPRYTITDLERFPEDGNRYELLDGLLPVLDRGKKTVEVSREYHH